ncbi:DUF6308 family protein [Knoellia sp. Soil729]|uniref:DUF6308 family protein n=1 Tax=Knoellia sp. Soil729 TaxID=1736394 RepID=UPI0006FD20D6|nr:DUF6308 family protein [Knoellia sp. Soil729]KRE41045.1 hypothetical protein ASG74_14360 [Knoellia sp. Soil729]
MTKVGQQSAEQLLRLGVDGFGPFSSAEQWDRDALRGRSKDEAVKVLVRNHFLVAGNQGLLTNIGGFITMPVTMLANIRAALQAGGQALHHRLLALRDEADLPASVSALRVFYVIAWRDGKDLGH